MHPEKQKKIIILAAVLVGIVTLPGGCNTLLGGSLFSGGFLGLQQQEQAPAEPAYQSPLWEEEGLDARQAEYAGFLETVSENRLAIYDGTIPVVEDNWLDENTGFNEEYTDEQLEALTTAPEPPPGDGFRRRGKGGRQHRFRPPAGRLRGLRLLWRTEGL